MYKTLTSLSPIMVHDLVYVYHHMHMIGKIAENKHAETRGMGERSRDRQKPRDEFTAQLALLASCPVAKYTVLLRDTRQE